MANLNEEFSGDWLKAADLKDKRVNVIVKDAPIEIDKSGNKQVVLYFEGKEKKFGLNVTNRRMMQMHFGDDTDDFVGKRITLRPDRTPNPQGQIVDCIRVDGELPEQKAQAAPVAANSADDDDDLPF